MAEETFTIKAKDATKAAFDSVERGLGKLGVSFNKFGISAGALTATMGVSLVAAAAAVVKKQADIADASIKSARAVGMNVEAYSALSYQASLAMKDAGALDSSLIKLTKNLGEAAQGTGTAKDAIKDLGLNARELAAMSPDQALEKIADGLTNVKNSNDKARIAQDLFGRSGSQMILLLEGGSEAMRESRAEADSFGKVISTETAVAAEHFNDNLTRLQALSSGVGMKMAANLLPALNGVTDAMVIAANESKALDGFGDALAFSMNSLASAAIGVASGFEQVVSWTIAAGSATKAAVHGNFAEAGDIMAKNAEEIIRLSERTSEAIDKIWNPKIPQDGKRGGNNLPGGDSELLGKGTDKKDDPAEKFRQDAIRKYDAMNESLMTENERIEADYQAKLIALDNFYLTSEMTEDGYRARREQLEQDHQNRLRDIDSQGQNEQQRLWESSMNGKLQVTSDIFGSLATLMNSENKKQFEIGKKAAISQAVIDTYLGAQKAYQALAGIAVVGPALGVAAAAAAIAAGMQRVNAIRAQSYGGSGSSTTGGSATTTSTDTSTSQTTQPIGLPGAEDTQSQKAMNVYFTGNVMSEQFVADSVAPILRDLINENDIVIFNSGSRQAQEVGA